MAMAIANAADTPTACNPHIEDADTLSEKLFTCVCRHEHEGEKATVLGHN